jgi:hypothetical protein
MARQVHDTKRTLAKHTQERVILDRQTKQWVMLVVDCVGRTHNVSPASLPYFWPIIISSVGVSLGVGVNVGDGVSVGVAVAPHPNHSRAIIKFVAFIHSAKTERHFLTGTAISLRL